jgi:hypothetical protein
MCIVPATSEAEARGSLGPGVGSRKHRETRIPLTPKRNGWKLIKKLRASLENAARSKHDGGSHQKLYWRRTGEVFREADMGR